LTGYIRQGVLAVSVSGCGAHVGEFQMQQRPNEGILSVDGYEELVRSSGEEMTVPTQFTDSVRDAMPGNGVFLRIVGGAMLFVAVTAFAGDGAQDVLADARDSQTMETVLEPDGEGFSEGSRLQVGMPIEQAIELLGGSPDDETEVGAACGMLDILTWDDNGTQIISVDGTVTSIVKDGTGQD